jgi:hypothetical protein
MRFTSRSYFLNRNGIGTKHSALRHVQVERNYQLFE